MNYCETCVREEYCLQKSLTRCTWYAPRVQVKWESMQKVVIGGTKSKTLNLEWLKEKHQ